MFFLYKLIPILVVILTFPSIGQWVNLPIGYTTVWWITDIITLYAFFIYKKNFFYNTQFPIAIKCFLIWVTVSAVYGFFMADYYWDYKLLLNNLMIYLMGLSFFFLSIPENILQISQRWCYFAIVAFWFILPFMQFEAPGKFLAPFAFFLLFWPFYTTKWKFIVIFFSLAIIIYGSLGARSTVVRFSFSFITSIIFLMMNQISLNVIKKITYLLMISPCILFILGISGIFNIWNFNHYLGNEEILVKGSFSTTEKDAVKENLKTDTRTFLYEETILSAVKNNYVIQGRSLSRGYDSPFFSWMIDFQLYGTQYHKGERPSSEVAILNIFTYMGLIGVFLYGFIFFSAIRNVFQNANNKCLYIIAMYVAFRWTFAWMEDFTRFDLNNLYLWVMISMCFSPYFLQMSDDDFKIWASNIFQPYTKRG